MSPTLDGVDTATLWVVSVPLFAWWFAAVAAVGCRLEDRHFDVSIGAVRAHVGRMEIAEAEPREPAAPGPASRACSKAAAARTLAALPGLLMLGAGYVLSAPLVFGPNFRHPAQRRRAALVVGELYGQAQPFLVLALWGACVLSLVRGGLLFGLMVLSLGPAATVLLWGFHAWRACGWSIRAAGWLLGVKPRVLAIAVCACVAWLLACLAVSAYVPRATAWLFLSAQLLPLCLERVDAMAPHKGKLEKLFELAKAGDGGVGAGTRDGGVGADKIDAWCKPTLRRVQATGILVAYAAWVVVAAPPSGKSVGLLNACAVLFTDGMVEAATRVPGQRFTSGSIEVLLLQAGARLVVSLAGQHTWFLGHACVFLLIGCWLVSSVVHRRMLASVAAAGLLGEGSLGRAALRQSHFHNKEEKPWPRLMAWLGQYMDKAMLYVLLLAFVLEIAILAFLRPERQPPSVGFFEQWALGAVAVGLLLTWAGVLIMVEAETVAGFKRAVAAKKAALATTNEARADALREANAPSRTKRLVILVSQLAAIGVVLFVFTKSFAVLATFCFLPTVLICSAALRQQWEARGCKLADDASAPPPRDRRNTLRGDPGDDPGGTTVDPWRLSTGVSVCDCGGGGVSSCFCGCAARWRGGDFSRVRYSVALLRCGLSVTDAVTVGTAGLLGLSLIAWGVLAGAGGWAIGWSLPVGCAEALALAAARLAWHHTLRLRSAAPPAAAALALHVALHAGLLRADVAHAEALGQGSTLSGWGALVVLSFLGWPAAGIGALGWRLLWDGLAGVGVKKAQARKLLRPSPKAVACLATCGAMLLLAAFIIIKAYSAAAGGALAVAVLASAFGGFVYFEWRGNKYFLPVGVRVAVGVVLASVVAACVLLGSFASSGIHSFALFSLALFACVGCLCVAAVADLAEAGQAYTSFACSQSAVIFPLVRYDADRQMLVVKDRPVVWLAAACGLVLAWSALAVALLPEVYAGVSVAATVVLAAAVGGVAAATEPTKKLVLAVDQLRESQKRGLGGITDAGIRASVTESREQLLPAALLPVLRNERTRALLATLREQDAAAVAVAGEAPPESSRGDFTAADQDADERWALFQIACRGRSDGAEIANDEAELLLSVAVVKMVLRAAAVRSAKAGRCVPCGLPLRADDFVACPGSAPGAGDPFGEADVADPEIDKEHLKGLVRAAVDQQQWAFKNHAALCDRVRNKGLLWLDQGVNDEGAELRRCPFLAEQPTNARARACGAGGSWGALLRLQKRARTCASLRALVHARFQMGLIAAAERAEAERRAHFDAFVAWVRKHVGRAELGDLALPLLGPDTASSSSSSSASSPDVESGVGTAGGASLAEVLAWAPDHRDAVAALSERFEQAEAKEKEAAEAEAEAAAAAARRRQEILAARRSAGVAGRSDEPFEVEESLPERLRKGKEVTGWASARSLGITSLASRSSDMSLQTGTSRFAAEDVCQGIIGDCWLLSAMSLVALHPEAMEEVFKANREVTIDGEYTVRLFKEGAWQDIKINDRLPVRDHGNGKKTLSFVRSVNNDELWPSLLEKAYAKYYGGYGEIEGGYVHLGLVDLTGGVGSTLKVSGPGSLDPASLWASLVAFHAAGDLVGAGSTSGRDTDSTPRGIVKGHAYAVLRVAEVDGTRLLQLRNPWGTQKWSGPFSDHDPGGRWTPRLKEAVGFSPATQGRSEKTGVFWMEHADFVREFESIYVCRLFKTTDARPPGPWHKESIAGCWSVARGTAGGYQKAATEPQLRVTFKRPAQVFATLTLDHGAKSGGRGGTDGHGGGTDRAPVFVALFLLEAPADGSRAKSTVRGKVASSAPFTNMPTVSVSASGLKVRDSGYILLPTTFAAGTESPWTITIFADEPFELHCGDIW